MNDFTKEELKEIKRCLKYMIKGGITPYSLLTISIDKKIQAMIDNYVYNKTTCKHENDRKIHIFNQPGELGSFTMKKCNKCREFYK